MHEIKPQKKKQDKKYNAHFSMKIESQKYPTAHQCHAVWHDTYIIIMNYEG